MKKDGNKFNLNKNSKNKFNFYILIIATIIYVGIAVWLIIGNNKVDLLGGVKLFCHDYDSDPVGCVSKRGLVLNCRVGFEYAPVKNIMNNDINKIKQRIANGELVNKINLCQYSLGKIDIECLNKADLIETPEAIPGPEYCNWVVESERRLNLFFYDGRDIILGINKNLCLAARDINDKNVCNYIDFPPEPQYYDLYGYKGFYGEDYLKWINYCYPSGENPPLRTGSIYSPMDPVVKLCWQAPNEK